MLQSRRVATGDAHALHIATDHIDHGLRVGIEQVAIAVKAKATGVGIPNVAFSLPFADAFMADAIGYGPAIASPAL